MSYMKQNKKRKQTLVSAQYRLENLFIENITKDRSLSWGPFLEIPGNFSGP